MDKKRQELYEKLAKLIELRDGTDFDGERAAAERAIAKLLAQYSLDLSNLRSGQDIIIKEIKRTSKRRDNKEFYLFGFIAKFCGVALFFSSKKKSVNPEAFYRYIGRKADIESAIFLTDILKQQIETMVQPYVKAHIKVKLINSYKLGLMSGVEKRFNEISAEVLKYQQQEGLIPFSEFECRYNEARAFILKKAKILAGTKILITNGDAYSVGVNDSDKINIHAPIASQRQQYGITHVSNDK